MDILLFFKLLRLVSTTFGSAEKHFKFTDARFIEPGLLRDVVLGLADEEHRQKERDEDEPDAEVERLRAQSEGRG